MKTSDMIMMKADNLKTYGDIVGKAGMGMKLAALLGYKFGYGMGKHPQLHKFKKHMENHPKAGIMAIAGLVIGAIGITSFLRNSKSLSG